MPETDAEKLFNAGLELLAQGNTLSALSCFEKAAQVEDRPVYTCHLALCIAKERGQFQLAVALCEKAIGREPQNPVHYLNLGRIFVIAGKKENAIKTFREGLRYEKDQQIIDELERLGTRKPPIVPFIRRNNPINKYLGILMTKLRLR